MNKRLICTAVGGALALGGGAASAYTSTSYGTLLVPYVVKDANRTTVVTTIMYFQTDTYGKGDLHLQYWTKSTTDANTAACQPSSVQVPVTPNDIVTFDTAGLLGYPLFGDTTNPAPLGVGISYAAPRHGYLVIQSPWAYSSGATPLYLRNAYWLELDLANGGAHGDQAINSPSSDGNFSPLTTPTMSLWGDPDPSNNNHGTPVNFWPASVASTSFTVTPLGSTMMTRENNQVVMQVLNGGSLPLVQGAYDRNENGVDGTVPQTVRCVGRLTPAQLMPGVVANAGWATQGGWGNLVNLGNNNNTAVSTSQLKAAVYQVDTAMAAGKFVDNATRITSQQY